MFNRYGSIDYNNILYYGTEGVHANLQSALHVFDLLMQKICEKNKANRDQVKFHQTTDSRSYPLPYDNLVSQTYGCGFPDVKFCFYIVIVYIVSLASANKCFI